MEITRVVLIRYISERGDKFVGSGLLVSDRVVLTSNVVGSGTEHEVQCVGKSLSVLNVVRSGTTDIDLATLTISEPIAGLSSLRYGRIDRGRVGWVDNCVALGFPRWKREGNTRRLAQVNGKVLTAEGLEASTDFGLRAKYLTLVVDRDLGVPGNLEQGMSHSRHLGAVCLALPFWWEKPS